MSIKNDLNMLFDNGTILSLLKKLLDVYWENLDQNAKRRADTLDEKDAKPDTAPYFDKCKLILEFFADDDCMNSFGENNTSLIRKTLSDPTTSNSEDFIIFLSDVVKADLADESEVEGETSK